MPEKTAALKINATKSYGGNVVLYDGEKKTRDALVKKYKDEKGMTIIPPYDHHDVIAGQGTAAKELIEEVGQLDHLFVCVGGGALISGSCLAAKELSPKCQIHGVEPQGANDAQQSLAKGHIIVNPKPKSVADGVYMAYLGELTFEIMKKHITSMLTASDQDLINSMKFVGERMKMIVEPTGCLGLAGVRNCKIKMKSKKVGVIVSGGNVDLKRYAELVKN